MAITHAAQAKAEGDHRASSKHPLSSHALARFAYHVGFPQLGQSFLEGVRSDAAPPISTRDNLRQDSRPDTSDDRDDRRFRPAFDGSSAG
jgi:hypothetical protein